MAKTKTPFLSMGSSGTIGGAITSQKRGVASLLRTKPTPADPYSLPQAYQRWLYQDYCAEWSALSDADKQTWKSAASRYHMPGMAYFLRNRLNTLPDIAGGWHLDYITGGSVIDFSKNLNHGTVYGATLVDGLIDHALSFDGIDDYVLIPHHSSLSLTSAITILLFIHPIGHQPNYIRLVEKWWQTSWAFWLHSDDRLGFQGKFGGVGQFGWSTGTVPINQWSPVAITYDSAIARFYIGGLPAGTWTPPTPGLIGTDTDDVVIGRHSRLAAVSFHGYIDHCIIPNIALSPADILRHSLRRYP